MWIPYDNNSFDDSSLFDAHASKINKGNNEIRMREKKNLPPLNPEYLFNMYGSLNNS
jgi:hypothetical protein